MNYGGISDYSSAKGILCIPTNLASVHALVCDESLGIVFEFVWLSVLSESFHAGVK